MKAQEIGSHVEIYPYEGNKINVFNTASGKTYLIGEKEAKVLILLDGYHSLEEIADECSFYTLEEIEELIKAFSDIGLFEKKKKQKSILKIKMRLINPNAFFRKDGRLTKILFNLVMIGSPIMLVIGVAYNALTVNANANYAETISMIIDEYMSFNITDFIVMYMGFFTCLMIHELAHTVAARYYGVNVPEVGLMLYFFIPCAYTNISGINLLKSKKERLLVLAAGSFSNLGLIGILYAALSIVQTHISALFIGLIILNAGTLVTNGMIYLKFDGYYMLEVILDEIRLRDKSMSHLKRCIKMMLDRDKGTWYDFREGMSHDYSKYLTHQAYLAFSLLSSAYIPFTIANAIISITSLA